MNRLAAAEHDVEHAHLRELVEDAAGLVERERGALRGGVDIAAGAASRAAAREHHVHLGGAGERVRVGLRIEAVVGALPERRLGLSQPPHQLAIDVQQRARPLQLDDSRPNGSARLREMPSPRGGSFTAPPLHRVRGASRPPGSRAFGPRQARTSRCARARGKRQRAREGGPEEQEGHVDAERAGVGIAPEGGAQHASAREERHAELYSDRAGRAPHRRARAVRRIDRVAAGGAATPLAPARALSPRRRGPAPARQRRRKARDGDDGADAAIDGAEFAAGVGERALIALGEIGERDAGVGERGRELDPGGAGLEQHPQDDPFAALGGQIAETSASPEICASDSSAGRSATARVSVDSEIRTMGRLKAWAATSLCAALAVRSRRHSMRCVPGSLPVPPSTSHCSDWALRAAISSSAPGVLMRAPVACRRGMNNRRPIPTIPPDSRSANRPARAGARANRRETR